MKRHASLIAAASVSAALVLPFAAATASAAQAAGYRPSARLVLANSDITAGSAAHMRYSTAWLPAGSVVHLQERLAGPGHAWITGAPLGRAGTITAPGAPAGDYLFRIQVTDAGHPVVASPAARLTVTQANSGNTILGSIWNWVKHESSAIAGAVIVAAVLSWLGL